MDVDSNAVSNIDDWLARFSPAGTFPFDSHKTQLIEYRRARMADLLIFDVLLIRGGIRNPDAFFPPADWASLRNLLDAIDQSAYDILKKDCLVYILLKWAWDIDTKESNTGWDARYLQDRCIAPQFVELADAYWLLDTGTHLPKAVSILSDARLNRDYVSKILQALSLSSFASFDSGASPATAGLVVKYIRTAKPPLTEPDDIDLYTLSLAHLSFLDAWAYQKTFPEGSDTRERLLGKLIAWCLMPTPKQESLAQLLAFPLSSYEQTLLHALALPSQFLTAPLANVKVHITSTQPKRILSSQAISILQDLLCVRAIQSGDYVQAIKLDRQFTSVSPTPGSAAPFDVIDRKAIIQDLFALLPPAERILLEDEIGKVATGVRANASTSTPSQGTSTRKPLVAELSLSASWEDVGASMGSPAPSVPGSLSSSVVAPPASVTPIGKSGQPPLSASASASPFLPRVARPSFGLQAPPTPRFTAFGSPIPSASGGSATRGVITERAKTLFSGSAVGGSSAHVKPAPRASLFDITGSAKNAPNAFYKPPSVRAIRASIDVNSALGNASAVKQAEPSPQAQKQNGKAQRGESDGEDVSMGSGSDVEILEEHHRDESGGGQQEEIATDEDEEDVGRFLTHEKSGAADLTFHVHQFDETMDENHDGPELGFSVFSEGRNVAQNGNVGGQEKKDSRRSGHDSYISPPRRAPVSPSREGDKKQNTSTVSPMTTRPRAPPGAFHPEEEEDDEDQHEAHPGKVGTKVDTEEDEDDRVLQTTPTHSPRRSARTRRPSETPSRPSRAQPQRSFKTTTSGTRPSTRSARPSRSVRHSIPGALIDDDNDHDEHEQDDADHTDVHADANTDTDDQEEDDAIAPLPSRATRRTRDSSFSAPKTTTTTKPSAPPAVAKGKAKARLSETKTPTRRSSRLSVASSGSPEHPDVASPTKRKSAGSRALVSGSSSGAVATRSSARRKR